MLNRRLYRVILLLISIMFLISSNVRAEVSSSVDEGADKVLRQMSAYMNSLQQFTLRAYKTTEEILTTGQKLQFGSTVDLFIRRPDRFRVESKDSFTSNKDLFYDGKTITAYGKHLNLYAVMDVPSTIDNALKHALESYALDAPMAEFIVKNSYDTLIDSINSGYYLGLDYVQGVECHHLAFRQDDIDWQIWIENSKTPVPRKFIITHKWVVGAPQFTVVFADWNLSPRLKDRDFVFVPPDGSKKIDFLPAR
jgi:hypothetical protein